MNGRKLIKAKELKIRKKVLLMTENEGQNIEGKRREIMQ
jgi:hypothetical protein